MTGGESTAAEGVARASAAPVATPSGAASRRLTQEPEALPLLGLALGDQLLGEHVHCETESRDFLHQGPCFRGYSKGLRTAPDGKVDGGHVRGHAGGCEFGVHTSFATTGAHVKTRTAKSATIHSGKASDEGLPQLYIRLIMGGPALAAAS